MKKIEIYNSKSKKFQAAFFLVILQIILFPGSSLFAITVGKTSINPKQSVIYYVPVAHQNPGITGELAPRLRNRLDVKYEDREKNIKVQSSFLVDVIPNTEDKELTGEEKKDQKSYLLENKILENSIKWSPGKFIIGMGLQYFTWGKADGLNPTDNINPKNYNTIELEDDLKKIPVFSLSVEFFPIEQVSIQGIYIPYYQKSIYPETEINTDGLIQTPNGFNGSYLWKGYEIDEPGSSAKYSSGGGKLNFFFQSLDFSLSYLFGYEPFYTPAVYIEYQADLFDDLLKPDFQPGGALASVKLYRRRMHYMGADFKVIIGSFSFWGEGCFTMYKDRAYKDIPEYNDKKVQWTAGIEYEFGFDYNLNLQYSGRYIFNYDDALSKDYDPSSPGYYGREVLFYKEFYYRSILPLVSNEQEALRHVVAMKIYPKPNDDLFRAELTAGYSFVSKYDKDRYNQNREHEYKRLGGLSVIPKLIVNLGDNHECMLGAYIRHAYRKRTDDSDSVDSDDEDFWIGRWRIYNYIFMNYTYTW